jgi:hypothetical protein
MNKTFKQLLEADSVVAELYLKDKALENSKFGYAWRKFYEKNITPINKEFHERLEDLRIENALEDSITKEIIYGEPDKRGNKPYKFSREGLTKLTKQVRELNREYDNKEIEVVKYISSYVPKLTEEETEILKGLVIE